jgi:hypothetical protein
MVDLKRIKIHFLESLRRCFKMHLHLLYCKKKLRTHCGHAVMETQRLRDILGMCVYTYIYMYMYVCVCNVLSTCCIFIYLHGALECAVLQEKGAQELWTCCDGETASVRDISGKYVCMYMRYGCCEESRERIVDML